MSFLGLTEEEKTGKCAHRSFYPFQQVFNVVKGYILSQSVSLNLTKNFSSPNPIQYFSSLNLTKYSLSTFHRVCKPSPLHESLYLTHLVTETYSRCGCLQCLFCNMKSCSWSNFYYDVPDSVYTLYSSCSNTDNRC